MKVEFEKIKFKNILSYGNAFTTFSFENGLTAITGKNGHGKSSILDILSFAIFGQPYRKIKIAELINKTNNKAMFVEVKFTIDSNKFIIQRGIKPNILAIFKNDEEVELLSSKALIQEEINETIGIDYLLFKQIIALAVNANKPFLTLSAYDKRNIVDTIFNINVFGNMTKLIKKTIADIKVNLKIKTNELNDSFLYLTTVEKRFNELVKTKNSFEEDKKRDIKLVNDSILLLENDIKKSNDNIKIGNDYQSNLIINDVEKNIKNLKDINNKLNILQYEKKMLLKDNKYIESNEFCNVCKSKITEEHKNIHIKDTNEKIKTINEEIETKTNNKSKEEEIILKADKIIKEKTDVIKQIENQQNKLHILTIKLENNNNMKKSAEDRTFSVDLVEFENDVIKKRKIYELLKDEVDDIQYDLDVNNLMSDVISENGVKSHFMKKLLPLLNSKIAKYLEEFEMPFIMTFDELLNESIISISTKGGDINYYSCSEGEKQKLNLSILLSFIDIIKSISNWSCNIMFFDELLDSAVDPTSLVLILQTIKKMTTDNKMATYIISHRAYDGGIFDSVVEIEKRSNFSFIKEN